MIQIIKLFDLKLSLLPHLMLSLKSNNTITFGSLTQYKFFAKVIDPDIIPGNLTATISVHLLQFSIIPNMFGNIPGNKSNIYERDWSKFDR